MNIFNIARQFLLSVVLVASLTTSLMAFDFKDSFVEGYNQYQARYAGTPISKEEIISVTSISCEGAYAKRGYEVALNNGKVIFCKDMKKNVSLKENEQHLQKFEIEKERLLGLGNFLNGYERESTADMPKFAGYCAHLTYTGVVTERDDEEHNMLLLSKASGNSLFNRFIEIALSNFSNTFEKEDSVRQIETTGRSIAKFHLHFKQNEDNSPTFKTITHGDLHLGNLFVASEPNFEVNFIDYETLANSINKLDSVNTDIGRLFAFSKDTLQERVEEGAKDAFDKETFTNKGLEKRPHTSLTPEQKNLKSVRMKKSLEQLEACYKSLAKGYEAGLFEGGLQYRVSETGYGLYQ